MLTSLSIKNYALIDNLQVDFNSGLTIITGETGAGKSILLGALSLVLGKRADLSSVKNTSEKCVVEAVFDIASHNLKSVFQENDLDYEPQTIIRREILPSGKSRAFVNDTPVNLENLSALGDFLIDIHSQHQTLQLTHDDFQFQVIDELANVSDDVSKYKSLLDAFKSLDMELENLKAQKAESLKELDYNSFLLHELGAISLQPGDLETLEEEYETLNNIEEINEHLTVAHQLLSDEQTGVLNVLTQLKSHAQKLAAFSGKYQELFERIASTSIELDDLYSEVEAFVEALEANPNRLEEVSAKLEVLNNLLKKHSVGTIEELIEIREALKTTVSFTENLDETIALKEREITEMANQLDSIAGVIHKKRTDAIPGLVSALKNLLETLGMPQSQFKIEVVLSEDYYVNGKDKLTFLFSANKGGTLNELKKVASGGELSRIMLAIKSVLASYVKLPTIIFDEIDTGVSGEISNKMASIMKQMSMQSQVITITHLPQIAAKGDTHFKVFKEEKRETTATNMVKLNPDDRIVEIAQMLGGKEMSSSAIAHAKQLLN